ncbi:MAG: hypothetical protein K6T61_01345 [Bryobacteraceae bacterium]|nr:hypothetical protein [Bryobacteraceae bacterium]
MTNLQQEFATLTTAPPLHFGNLTVLPLLRTKPSFAEPGYLLLEEAMRRGAARVVELDGGSVPEIRFENMADEPVLILDGEELIGAKQNRALNLTILAPPKQTITIPVSCVEAGRWSNRYDPFMPGLRFLYSKARRDRSAHVTESLWQTGAPRSDQGALWADIEEKAARLGAHSPTQAMGAIYERHSLTLEEYARAFPWQERQAGVAFAIGGTPFGLDLLDHPKTMQAVLPRLIRSYALDALELPQRQTDPCPAEQFQEFMRKASEAPAFTRPAVGLGKDVRFQADGVTGAALWAEERYVHVCAFRSDENGQQYPRWGARFSRPSRRRSA